MIHDRARGSNPSRILAGVACGILTVASSAAQSQESSSTIQTQRQYDIPAGALDSTLKTFASQAGVMLSIDASLTQGKYGPGIKGSYSVEQGFRALIAGSDLQVIEDADHSYSVRARSPERQSTTGSDVPPGTQTLSRVRVESQTVDPTTEGSGSYTSSAITIGKTAHSLRETPQSVSVVTRQRMDDQNFSTLGDALEQVTGVDSVDGIGQGFSTFYSRGGLLTPQYDGVPAAAGTTNQSTQALDLAIYDRLEVLRGPAGLLQGAGNASGVVNLVRKRPQSDTRISTSLAAGSWNNYHGDIDVTGALNNEGTLRARAVVAGLDREFYYDVAEEQSWTGYAIVEFDLAESTTLGLSYAAQRGDLTPFNGLPASITGDWLPVPRSTFIGMDWLSVDRGINEVVADLNHRFGNDWVARATLRQRDWDRDQRWILTRSAVDPAVNRTVMRLDHWKYDYESVGADLNISGPLRLFGRTHEWVVGYNFDQYEERGGLALVTFPDEDLFNPGIVESDLLPVTNVNATRTEQTGFYGMARVQLLDSLTAVIGGRLSDYNTKTRALAPARSPWTNSSANTSDEFTPYGGLIWDVSSHFSLYASYAESFSPQAITDFFGEVLEPVIGWQVESGIKGEFFDGQLNTSLALFRTRNENSALLDPDPTHVGCGGTPDGACSIASGLTEIEGWELEISGSPLPGWELSAGYADNETTIIKDSDPANIGQPISSYNPARMLKLWSNYRFASQFSGSVLRGLNVGLGVESNSTVRTSNLYVVRYGFTPVEQSGYTVLNAQVGYRFSNKLQVSLTVNNLTDRKYFRYVNDARSFNYYGDPRYATLSVRSTF